MSVIKFLPYFVQLLLLFSNIQDDHKLADDNYNAQLNMYIADTVDGEVAGEGYGLYEDELNEQDDYLEDVGELKDESSGSRTF